MKTCSSCKKSKPLEEFNRKGKGYQGNCRSCNTAYQKQHYIDNKAKYSIDNGLRRVEANKAGHSFLREVAKNGCSLCFEKDYCCLEFDHIDPSKKKMNISKMLDYGYSVAAIKLEVDKCRVLCANCHRKHTATQFNWYKNHRTVL